MSSLRSTQSFRSIKQKAIKLENSDYKNFDYRYDNTDLTNLRDAPHLLGEMGGIQGLAAALRTDLKAGLLPDEVKDGEYDRRKKMFGQNSIPMPPPKTYWELCLEALGDPTLMVLIGAGIISVIAGAIDGHSWIEGCAILVAVIVVVNVGAVNNWTQEREFRRMDAQKEPPKSYVFRGGQTVQVLNDDLLVGDIVQLNPGGLVPADGILVTDSVVTVSNAAMTGESIDVTINYEKPVLLGGQEIRTGDESLMLVTNVGTRSYLGEIKAALTEGQSETPLQSKLNEMTKKISYMGLSCGLAMFIILFARWGAKGWNNGQEVIGFFIIAITIVVVSIPEGLPLAVILSLVYSMGKMQQDNNLVRALSACETMGNATTICSDKTGTLTVNKMTVTKCWLAGVGYKTIPAPSDLSEPIRRLIAENIVVNSKARVDPKDIDHTKEPEQWKWQEGNQTDHAMVAWTVRYGFNLEQERSKYVVTKSYPIDSVKKFSSIIVPTSPVGTPRDRMTYRRYFKGAAERLFTLCSHVVDREGVSHAMTPEESKNISNEIDNFTRNGLRTVAFCYSDLARLEFDDNDNVVDPADATNAVLVGFVGIKDPLRYETRASVRQCQRAGIIVRMVTGDHIETAKFIARDCGILTSDDHVAMTGEEFAQMYDARAPDLDDKMKRLRVLARSRPKDKEKMVTYYQEKGEVVAVTGDGTNDAPALRKANVGLAMFITGTDVARGAADILILDDNFASIVKSVMWGRCVYDNIRKFVQFQLVINVVALGLSLIGALADFEKPLTAVQLLWVNLIMDTFAALALATERPTFDLLNRRPYRPDATLITPIMWRNILGHGIYQLAILCLLLFGNHLFWWKAAEKSQHHYSIIFNTFIYMQLFNEINSRKVNEEMNVFENFFSNWLFHVIWIGTALFQIIIIEFFGSFAQTYPLPWDEYLFCVALGATELVWGAILRLIPFDKDSGRVEISAPTFANAELDKGVEDDLAILKGEKVRPTIVINQDAASAAASSNQNAMEMTALRSSDHKSQ